MDIVVNVNIDTKGEEPEVIVKKPNEKLNKSGGVLQFPEVTSQNNPILDILGIKET
jgi:hypothetical protein